MKQVIEDNAGGLHLSHPAGVRGLKPVVVNRQDRDIQRVAPRRGAWIETAPM